MNNESFNILIVEDEFITANAIKEALVAYGHNVIGIARDALDAIEILDKNEVDLAILDINIQGSKNGIWLGNKISSDYKLPFIFLTAYGDDATVENAIAAKPSGYLTKPFRKVDIQATISLAVENQRKQLQPNLSEVSHSTKTVFVKGMNNYLKIVVEDILYIQSDLKFVTVHTADQEYSLRYNLNKIGEHLPHDLFIKVHRSFIVNKAKIDGIGPNYLEVKGQRIPISANRKEEVLSQFDFL